MSHIWLEVRFVISLQNKFNIYLLRFHTLPVMTYEFALNEEWVVLIWMTLSKLNYYYINMTEIYKDYSL